MARSDGTAALVARPIDSFGPRPETPIDSLNQLQREFLTAVVPEQYALACEAIADCYTSDLTTSQTPTLVVAGAHKTELRSGHDGALAGLSIHEVIEIAGAGDWPALECPQEFGSLVDSFLTATDVEGAA